MPYYPLNLPNCSFYAVIFIQNFVHTLCVRKEQKVLIGQGLRALMNTLKVTLTGGSLITFNLGILKAVTCIILYRIINTAM
jgi:hypothetical protein